MYSRHNPKRFVTLQLSKGMMDGRAGSHLDELDYGPDVFLFADEGTGPFQVKVDAVQSEGLQHGLYPVHQFIGLVVVPDAVQQALHVRAGAVADEGLDFFCVCVVSDSPQRSQDSCDTRSNRKPL